MSKGKPIRVYDYVNKPYEDVREQLIWIGLEVFYKATKTAAAQAGSLKPELHVNFGEFRLGADISTKINSSKESETSIAKGRVTTIEIEWEAARMPRLFPMIKAELLVYPLTSTETQLQLEGYVEPPFGLLGNAVDDIAGHRIAQFGQLGDQVVELEMILDVDIILDASTHRSPSPAPGALNTFCANRRATLWTRLIPKEVSWR